MPLQDVSNDQSMIGWLRQQGHGHLLDSQLHNASSTASPPSPPLNTPSQRTTNALNYPPQSTSTSSPLPMFGGSIGSGGFNPASSQLNSINRSSSFRQTDHPPTSHYGEHARSLSPPIIPPTGHFNAPSYDHQSSPIHFGSPSPTHFLTSNMNQQQLDVDIENMKRDPNTRVVQRPPQEDVVYKQRVFVRYLQPPTPPVGGTIIVREKQPPAPPPDPPIVIKRAPPAPPTPPPVIIRERPPPLPAAEGTTVIDKIVPPAPKPPRQVVIEQYPPLPPKPQDVIIERWLPVAPRQRRILYERLPPSGHVATRPIIVQYGPPQVRVQRELITAPGAQLPLQQVHGRADLNHVLTGIGGHHPSSLVSYNPHSALTSNYGGLGQAHPNIVMIQNGQPNAIPPSAYGTPLTCVCTPNQPLGLGGYGSGVSSMPTIGQMPGQPMVYSVPETVPIDAVLRQLGIDPHTIQRSASAPTADPRNAISHVWNAASHANVPHTSDSGNAVSHVWNAAAHATEPHRSPSPSVVNAWDRIEHYLHPQPSGAVRSAWNHIPHPYSSSPPANYPPPNYSPPPPPHYPPANHPPPPPSNYPPPNYSPPPPSNYPPSQPPPPQGGPGGAGASVLSRLFGGGR